MEEDRAKDRKNTTRLMKGEKEGEIEERRALDVIE